MEGVCDFPFAKLLLVCVVDIRSHGVSDEFKNYIQIPPLRTGRCLVLRCGAARLDQEVNSLAPEVFVAYPLPVAFIEA